MIKILSFQDILSLRISPKTCCAWVEEILINKYETILPPKISLHVQDDSFFNVMPCILPKWEVGGVKIVTRHPSREPALDSQIFLYNIETHAIEAILDGNWITAMRTGAVAAHSIMLFAKSDFCHLGIIGLGNTQRATIKMLFAICDNRELSFHILRYKNQHEEFASYLRHQAEIAGVHISVLFADTVEDLVSASDVVVSSVTYQKDDFCNPSFYPQGVLVVPVHSRGFMECDLAFDRVFCDDIEHIRGFKNFSHMHNPTEVATVLAGKASGRTSDHERILVYNIGLALHDVFFAAKILEMAKDSGVEIDLCSPTEKFYI